MKKFSNFALLFFFILTSIVCTAQGSEANYTHGSAKAEILETQQLIQSGKKVPLNASLMKYIYTNHENFPEIPEDASISQKLQTALEIYTALSSMTYTLLTPPADSISVEEAMLMATLGHHSAKILPIANEFLKSLDTDDGSYSVRINGYNQAIAGIKRFLVGYVITTFTENKNAETDAILAASIQKFGPAIIHGFPQEKQTETIDHIKANISPKVNERLEKEFQQFLDLL